jgi:ribosomal silencing factor RsfS
MAIVKKNLITQGLSGMLGGTLVFRRVGSKTIVSVVPSTTKAPTEAQQTQRGAFLQAVQYAKGQMSNPTIKAEYEALARGKGQPNAYNIAVADYFKAPDITQIDLSEYSGAEAQFIKITAMDDFKVRSVSVEVFNLAGDVIESGDAVMQSDSFDWVFTTTSSAGVATGLNIVIKATDMAGNVTLKRMSI